MFGFFSNLRKDVTQAVSSIHERLITLEVKVEALFNHVNTTAVQEVAAKVEAPVEAAATNVVAKVEAVATEVESKV